MLQVDPARPSVDVGLVVSDVDRALHFYQGVLGLPCSPPEELPDGAGRMYRLGFGRSVIKLLQFYTAPVPAARGISAASGYRYLTLPISNLAEATENCRRAGCRIISAQREVRPGVAITLMFDFEGNVVELLQAGSGPRQADGDAADVEGQEPTPFDANQSASCSPARRM